MTLKPILGAALGVMLTGAAYADEPRSVGATQLFAPHGYDDNDEIVVVTAGFLPSTCYQLAAPKVSTNRATRTVLIDLKAHVNPGPCVSVPVPFEQEVELGPLPAGDWTLETTVTPLRKDFSVVVSPSARPDEYLYAPIDDAHVVFDQAAGRWTAVLTGDILATCLKLPETKVLDQSDVVVLLPIIEQDGEDCQPTSEHFNHKVLLPEGLKPGRHLLHVRSLNGRGINRLFDVGG